MNIAKLFEEHVERFGTQTTLFFEGRKLSAVDTRSQGRKLGNALKGLGIKEGEVVAVSMSNCPEVLQSFGAVFRVGAVALPILFLLTEQEFRYILEDSGAVAVITDTTVEPKVLEATEGLESIRHIIVVGGSDTNRTVSYESLLEKSSSELPVVDKESDDIALIMYTSGTTALPKGVLLTHRNLHEAARALYAAQERTTGSAAILCLPLAHIYGVSVMNAGALSESSEGMGVVMRWFDPAEFFRLVEEYRVTMFPGVPTMFALLLNHPAAGKHDLSTLKDCISASAPLPMELQKAFMERFDCRVRQAYGLTESTGIGSVLRPSHPHRFGTVGKAYDNMELRIVDDDDNELGAGEIGELILRGPQVMKGYLNLPGETEEALRNGWLHTGDVGYMDDDGFLYITDRKKDLIIKAGENVVPAEIEGIFYRHPAVDEVAVVGIEDRVYGQDIAAYVVLKPGSGASAEELLAFAAELLPKFKRPREVFIIPALPKSSVGKILKRELVDLYEAKKKRA